MPPYVQEHTKVLEREADRQKIFWVKEQLVDNVCPWECEYCGKVEKEMRKELDRMKRDFKRQYGEDY